MSIISEHHLLYAQIMSYYNAIVSGVQKHTKLPSFCSKTTGEAQNIKLEWNETKYTATLTDTNGVLANYSFSADASGISFSTNGNKLTITADNASPSTVSITATKTNSLRRGHYRMGRWNLSAQSWKGRTLRLTHRVLTTQ